MNKIPDSLRIGGLDYKLVFSDDPLTGDTCWGRVDHITQTITLAAQAKTDKQIETLLHEVVHVLDERYAIGITERQVTAVAAGLWQVLRDAKILVLKDG